MTAITANLPINPNKLKPKGSITPQPINQESSPNEPKSDPIAKAALPAMDLLLLNGHLLFDPNLRPIKSANPSPTAMVAMDTIPIGESVQQKKVDRNKTKV
mmetsp:Transcript_31730/g.67260  ORF Transcript_31730/g.67260 Transcript_31730/m.67260 type:complete len:101 (-) Transcript_31730:953-1255(-)